MPHETTDQHAERLEELARLLHCASASGIPKISVFARPERVQALEAGAQALREKTETAQDQDHGASLAEDSGKITERE